jgi:alkylation response protein AidB-like acyl-CoA dehydrogenase
VLSEDGSHYVLNGTKQFITNAGFADLFTVFAKVDKQHFTGFLIERSFDGLELGPEEKKLGLHGSSTRQVIMNNVKVPVKNLLGEVGKGHKIAFNVLNMGRLKLGPICTGQIKYALAEGARYTNERKQFNVAISSFGAIQEKLADVAAMAFVSESAVYRVAGLIDDRVASLEKGSADYYAEYQKGIEEYAAECAMIKVYCTELAAKVIDEMLQAHGGYGFIAEYPIEQLYRDERVQRIYEGSNEINRMLIPGVFMRKGINGKAVDPSLEVVASGDLAAEKNLLRGMKQVYLDLADKIVATFGAKAANEQEILLALADVAIQVFALESALLRVEKVQGASTESKQALYRAVLKVCAFAARQKFTVAAEQCAVYVEDDELLELIGPRTAYAAAGLLPAKRLLAAATSQAEKYIF